MTHQKVQYSVVDLLNPLFRKALLSSLRVAQHCTGSTYALTDCLWGKEAWRPTHFSKNQIFFFHFPNELCYGYLRFEENGENPLGRQGKKVCPNGCLSLVLLNWDSQQGRSFSLPSHFLISFKPKVKVAISEFFWKMQRKTWYSVLGVDTMPLSLKIMLLSSRTQTFNEVSI